MTPATTFFASLSFLLWWLWVEDTWPPPGTPVRIGEQVLRYIGMGLLCALGAAVWTLTVFKVSP